MQMFSKVVPAIKDPGKSWQGRPGIRSYRYRPCQKKLNGECKRHAANSVNNFFRSDDIIALLVEAASKFKAVTDCQNKKINCKCARTPLRTMRGTSPIKP